MHAHLKEVSIKIQKNRDKFLQILRSILAAAQKKLNKYYEITFERAELYFNLAVCLNSCDKLEYYKISEQKYVVLDRALSLHLKKMFKLRKLLLIALCRFIYD
jgi:hypothetical protein